MSKSHHLKKSVLPSWKDSKFAKTIDGQAMVLLSQSIEDKHFIEAHTISWSIIEQLLLPRLITFVSKKLEIDLPKDILQSSQFNINRTYYFLSHDKKLFEKLESARIQRNKVIHELFKKGDIKSMQAVAKKSIEFNILLQKEIMRRFSGEALIPSINLYRNGWNDALLKVVAELKQMK